MYKHYWTIKRKLHPLDERVLKAIQAIIFRFKDILAFEYDEDTAPQISSECIRLNGIEDDGQETFVFWIHEKGFYSCMTERRAYDTPVAAILAILGVYYGDDIQIRSDGFDEDWEVPLQLAAEQGYDFYFEDQEEFEDVFYEVFPQRGRSFNQYGNMDCVMEECMYKRI
eukprot:TRINITY_DN5291_c0_g1_i2.p1 TRINITY_DN5291_c0_g1~~TRINITY_DN5291_c0_g1_i2.p1  ORF type:complete len:169 (-),score=30.00 TRINITY_DN5291_c0_g1_i2:545-1051(-)